VAAYKDQIVTMNQNSQQNWISAFLLGNDRENSRQLNFFESNQPNNRKITTQYCAS
jgi:hypothetical protein